MKIAIIGNGIVGATCAFYLGQDENNQIDVYDDNTYSGTKAAVGIVCPWVSQRRNKAWYELVEKGANFYDTLSKDLNTDTFMNRKGAIIIHDTLHEKLFNLAKKRLKHNPIMKHVTKNIPTHKMPPHFKYDKGFYIEGAFSIDGQDYLNHINQKTQNTHFHHQTVSLKTLIEKDYDKILIAAGARLEPLLNELNINMEHKAQKGMLLEIPYEDNDYAIIMPKGEIDFLFKKDALVIGASHENDYRNLDFDEAIKDDLLKQAHAYLDFEVKDLKHRIGLRSQNSQNLPFFGYLNQYPNIYCVGGLGSSGLTSGPYIGYLMSEHILHDTKLDERFDPNQFIKES